MELLIKNATIVDALKTIKADVYIDNGLIKEIGRLDKNCEITDAKGLYLMPSFVDMHTHLRDPG